MESFEDKVARIVFRGVGTPEWYQSEREVVGHGSHNGSYAYRYRILESGKVAGFVACYKKKRIRSFCAKASNFDLQREIEALQK